MFFLNIRTIDWLEVTSSHVGIEPAGLIGLKYHDQSLCGSECGCVVNFIICFVIIVMYQFIYLNQLLSVDRL